MIETFEPEVLRDRLIAHMKKNTEPVIWYAGALKISYMTLRRFLMNPTKSRTDVLFKIGIFLDKNSA